jgi:quercetin dioxygenase-like cupin family protein
VGVSKSLISQVERGKANPSVETARAIAAVLEVPLFSLFLEEDDCGSALVRRGERIRLTVPGSETVRELLTPDLERDMVLVLSRIRPGGKSSSSPASHKGEECVFVLRGILEVTLQDEDYVLEAGDTLYFDARVPHLFSNPSNTEVEFVCAMSVGSLPPV